jgi:predicted  nucleic acid-binding Zn ribbon protein
MIHHYLKVAFRNMWKYKGQTLISVVGLVAGFACFAVAVFCCSTKTSFLPNFNNKTTS